MALTALSGTQRTLVAGARVIGKAHSRAVTQVTVQVRSSKDADGSKLKAFVSTLADSVLSARSHLSREEYAAQFGAAPADFQKVRRFARQHGLRVVPDQLVKKTHASQLGHRTLELRGTNAALEKAFGVKLIRVREGKKVYRTYVGSLNVPDGYQNVIENVFGLDDRPMFTPKFKISSRASGSGSNAWNGYFPPQIAQLYNFPPGVTGKGQAVALLELGGGFRKPDLRKYFRRLGIKMPVIKAVLVGKARNHPTNPSSADGEVVLDIEVLGSVAPGATILVFFGPNASNRGFLRCVNGIIHDNLHKPTILSMSWGGPEKSYTAADLNSLDELFQAAAAMGVSVLSAAGDNGSTDSVQGGSVAQVDFPASSPWTTACGGTKVVSTGSQIVSETVWNNGDSAGNWGTGGGVSEHFAIPNYQSALGSKLPVCVNPPHVAGRGVPDVAGNADPNSGYNIRVDGKNMVEGGTSAVAPLWAGLTALINESLGKSAGFLNPYLYTQTAQLAAAFNDITQGNNDTSGEVGAYSAGPGWDPCSGLGSPNGVNVLKAVQTAT